MRLSFLVSLFLYNTVFAQIPDLSAYKIDSGYYKSFDNSKIYYEVRGNGEPILLVHGFVVNGESWKKTALYNNLLKAGYKVITLDMRGNGKSDKPHHPDAYANDAEAKDIMGLIDHLKIKKYMVTGYSRGAIIVFRLLILDKRVLKGVMGGMGTDFTNPDWPRRIMFYEALMGKDIEEVRGLKKHIREAKLDSIALGYLQKEQPATSLSQLKNIKSKVLVICGNNDSDNGSSQELAKLIPGSVHVTTPGTHNDANKTEEFSKAIIDFFSASNN